MSVSEAARDFVDKTLESTELAPRNEFHLEPRCRVCRNDLVRKKVNAMLACGGSYTQIVRALGDDNALLDKRDQVTVDRLEPTPLSISPCNRPLTPRTGRSWSGGLARIKSTSSTASPLRLLRSRSTRS